MQKRMRIVAILASLMLLAAPNIASAQQDDSIMIGRTRVDASLNVTNQEELDALLNSGEPISVVQSVTDGSILAVEPLENQSGVVVSYHDPRRSGDVGLQP
ncbi:hypothetical protein EP30_06385 [Bifidobacterium sp. UTCIF-39]|uniref:hypothetical protein n=1 Tax=Bifidobacterium sp. UTCIF-39 TaxID=1465359 RepID=UPI001125D89F|nr:hypothetical protein [Bifidobacterium sp. UTCIF-39]TPF96695.1 hypothetical protein EP30_06385 [Bifidobacterium sp. UTCIF-39]